MTSCTFMAWAGILVLLGAEADAGAEGIPACRVRLVRSAATEYVPRAVVGEVERWIDASGGGCKLVATVDDADVLLEFKEYRNTTTPEGAPAEDLFFVARRLSEPDVHRGIHRFAFRSIVGTQVRALVGKRLRSILSDVCLGYLPKHG